MFVWSRRYEHNDTISCYICFTPQINQLLEVVHGGKVFSNLHPPSPYTGELYGMEYLISSKTIQLQSWLYLFMETELIITKTLIGEKFDYGLE